ncbi:MAG: hypothetical protein KME59_01500 [Trichormus sp. ATA11-4-KO1]|nr:hypothetical protein [Trichormus sp. ATA11-4-KO1]
MFKSTFKSIAILFSSFAVVLTICESATAQLRVNERYSIPQGQEPEFLEFQRQHNDNIRQIRVMPDCTVGVGLGCNKTATVVEEIINQSNGTNYYQMLMRAAGGQDNYRNFAAFYDNNPQLPKIPYASFWRNEDPSIVDGYRYVLGQSVSRTPVPGLEAVTNNFAWSPSSRGREISLRDGLVNLKLSYGRVLLEEISAIPNFEQQVDSLDLPPDMTQFYLSNISRGLRALNTGDERALRESVLKLLSYPYSPGTPNDGWYGRRLVTVPDTLTPSGVQPPGGDTFLSENPVLGGEETIIALDTPFFEEVLLPSGGSSWLPYAAFMPLLFLLFSLGGDNDSSQPANVVEVIPETPSNVIPDNNGSSSNEFPEGTGNPTIPPPPTEVGKQVPEPSALKALLLLTLVLGILNYKHRFVPTKG